MLSNRGLKEQFCFSFDCNYLLLLINCFRIHLWAKNKRRTTFKSVYSNVPILPMQKYKTKLTSSIKFLVKTTALFIYLTLSNLWRKVMLLFCLLGVTIANSMWNIFRRDIMCEFITLSFGFLFSLTNVVRLLNGVWFLKYNGEFTWEYLKKMV
jgi:hypothetical protein